MAVATAVHQLRAGTGTSPEQVRELSEMNAALSRPQLSGPRLGRFPGF
jgi:hypothetical protein